MQHACERDGSITALRYLAVRYGAAELDHCLTAQLETQANDCVVCAYSARSVDLLARAAYVKHQVEEKAVTVNEAIRELARRMRNVQQMKQQGGTLQ